MSPNWLQSKQNTMKWFTVLQWKFIDNTGENHISKTWLKPSHNKAMAFSIEAKALGVTDKTKNFDPRPNITADILAQASITGAVIPQQQFDNQ